MFDLDTEVGFNQVSNELNFIGAVVLLLSFLLLSTSFMDV